MISMTNSINMEADPIRSHADLVVHLGRRILRGELSPGERVPGFVELKLSRTAWREAVRVLSAKGFLGSRPRLGTTVRPREEWHLLDPEVLKWRAGGADMGDADFVRELVGARKLMEPPVARLAALNATAKQRRELRQAYEHMERSKADWAEFIRADLRFHRILFVACGNELIRAMASAVETAFRECRFITARAATADSSMPIHREIMDAVCARDGERAEAAMRRLIDQVERDANQALTLRSATKQRGGVP